SRGSGPAVMLRASAVSATERASTPWLMTSANGESAGYCGMRPNDGFRPTRPGGAAGMRIQPPPSLPWVDGVVPAAVLAEEPPDAPPGVCFGFQGLRVVPWIGESVSAFQPYSGVVLLPIRTRPARRKRWVIAASSAAGVSSVE